jgi:hypothetical protein
VKTPVWNLLSGIKLNNEAQLNIMQDCAVLWIRIILKSRIRIRIRLKSRLTLELLSVEAHNGVVEAHPGFTGLKLFVSVPFSDMD